MTASNVELERRLGLADAIVVGAGSMIGAGVFVVWSPAARAAGDGLLIGLAIAAVVAVCNALSTAQLAALHPESGGAYFYGRSRLGAAWGHLAGWGFVVGKTASCAAIALAVGAYLVPGHARATAIVAVVAVTAINLGGLTRTVAVTKGLLAISLLALLCVVISGWTSPAASLSRVGPIDASPHDVLQSAGLLFFAFAGYARIATLGEEVRDPAFTIPRAIPIALAGVLLVYVVVAVTALSVIPVEQLATGAAPLRDVVEAGRWDGLAPVVRVGAGVASLGVLLNLIPGVTRTTLAMARNRELPVWLAAVDARRALPVRAELVVASAVMALVTIVEIADAIAISGVAVLTYYAIANAAALTLSPAQRRWPPAIAVVGLVGCAVLIVSLPLRSMLTGAGVLAAGGIVRRATSRRESFTPPW